MSDLKKLKLLKTRVTMMGIGFFVPNISWMLVTAIYIAPNLQHNILVCNLFGSAIGILTSVLLCIGINKDQAVFLTPFMLIMASVLVVLSGILILCFIFYITFFVGVIYQMFAYGKPPFALTVALSLLPVPMSIFLMIRITFWMWKNTKELFYEIRKIKKDSSSDGSVALHHSNAHNNHHVPNAHDGLTTSTTVHCMQVSDHGTGTDISPMVFERCNVRHRDLNGGETCCLGQNETLQYVVSLPDSCNLNDQTESTEDISDQPPLYHEIVSIFNATKCEMDIPPTYNEAMEIEKNRQCSVV